MSQNRQTEKDRLTASNEIIVEDLHNKIDLLICQQEQYKKDQEMLLKIIEELKDKTY